jgi:hypothetical protein
MYRNICNSGGRSSSSSSSNNINTTPANANIAATAHNIEDSLMKYIFVFDVDVISPLNSGNLSAIFTKLQIWFRNSIGWEGCTLKKKKKNRKEAQPSSDRPDYYYYYIRGAVGGKREAVEEKREEEEGEKWNCTQFHDIACKTIRSSTKFDAKVQAWILQLCNGGESSDHINRLLNVVHIKLKLLRTKEKKSHKS